MSTTTLNAKQTRALDELLEHIAKDAERHYVECDADERADHIYHSIYLLLELRGFNADPPEDLDETFPVEVEH